MDGPSADLQHVLNAQRYRGWIGVYWPRECGSTPAKVRKSVIRNVPFFAGRVGCHVGCADDERGRVGSQEAEEDLGDDTAADRAEAKSVRDDLRLLEDVVPERSAALEADVERRELLEVCSSERA